jgi:RHS repeat-associated protein
MMDDYRISEKLPKNAKNMVTDPTAPAILLGFAGSDPEFSDDIGNREATTEFGTNHTYTANSLNQYAMVGRVVSNAPQEEFIPQFDDDGNQTLIKTTTGIWQVQYNGENRPILWSQGTNMISMSYDRQDRRVTKNNQRFVYDGYLQIADNNGNAYVWDPTEKVATRPLAWLVLRSLGEGGYYTHDGNKNVSEVVETNGSVAAHYDYAPFGAVRAQTRTVAVANRFRFSSEYADDVLGLVYYNCRYYDPSIGRWLTRDAYEDVEVYLYCVNDPLCCFDHIGNKKSQSNGKDNVRQNKFSALEPLSSDIGILQRLVMAEVILPGEWKKKGISYGDATNAVNALLWCLCNRKEMKKFDTWTQVAKEKDKGKEQWKHFSNYPSGYNNHIRRRIVNFQRLAEKGVSPYSDFWEFIRNAAKNIDCQTQKSGFENNQSFKDNYKKGCSICYMRTAGHGLSVNGAVVIGTAGGNTFTISNVRTSEK